MPYKRKGKCVYKENPDGSLGEKKGCSGTVEGAKAYMRKLYQVENTKKSFSEMSMIVTKASRDKKTGAMRLALVNSDTGEDSFGEKMSLELFEDFVSRIENNLPVPEPFDKAICEDGWCGGMPYLSISHYKSDIGVPGTVEKVYIDGDKLKSHVILEDTELGRAVWKSIYNDLYEDDKVYENPVRVSIGFLDLQHKHEIDGKDDYIFTRTKLGQLCEKCVSGVDGKMYLKGILVHKAFTRVPANPRTSVEVEEMTKKSGIITRKGDAESIIGKDLVEELELKSEAAEEELIFKAEKDLEQYAWGVRRAFDKEFAPPPRPSLWVRSVTDKYILVSETNMEEDNYSSKLYKVGYSEKDGSFSFDKRSSWQEMELALVPKRSEADEGEWKFEFEDDVDKEDSTSTSPVKKSEVIMPKQDVVEKVDVEEEVVETPKEEPVVAAPIKSTVESAMDRYMATLAEVQKKGLHGDAAAKLLQPVMTELAKATEQEIADPMAGIADVVKSAISEAVQSLKPELVAEVLKAIPTGIQNKSTEVPAPRSIDLFKERAAPQTKEMSQIEKLAYQSTLGVANGQPQ